MADSECVYEPVGSSAVIPKPDRMEAGQLWRQYLIATVANIALISCGFALGWTSPINAKLEDAAQSPLQDPLTANQLAWVGSILTIGAIFGPFIGGLAAAKIGRKWGLLSATIPLFVGWTLISAANNVWLLYSGRVFWGIAIGMMFALSPMYCAEIATDEQIAYLMDESRGALGSFLQSFLSVGFMLVYTVGPYLTYFGVTCVGISVVAFFCLAFYYMPESPIYHLTKKNREAATSSLCIIRGRSREGVQAELEKMNADVQASLAKTITVTDLFKGSNLKALYLSCGLVFFQQFSGINAVLFYLTDIFEAAGSSLDSAVATIIVGAVQLIASFITPLVVDRLGRRILLLISSCGTSLGLGLLGAYFLLSSQEHPLAESLGWLPVLALMLFVVTFCWGLGPLPWAILSELFPVEAKAVAAPIATAESWVLSFLITRYFSSVAAAVGMHVAFWIFGLSCVSSFFFIFFLVPETKGKSFAEIQDMLAGRTKGSQVEI